MPLSVGSRLGPYEVISQIGAGGMGEVYRARDSKLDRDVAIKVLPESFALDADRLARFTREAKTLAALNHPNIASIYGIEGHALVMELVEGDDLSALIAQGPLPLAEALPIARQIADALEAAHEQGIIHRDLKPANIKVRADGTVKVLDFGLARSVDPSGQSDMANSPTLTARATQMGMIIGTAAYMSPEQARGKAVDRRADIWAFGVVLFEMLTGKRAFAGDDITDVLASVLKSDPDWSAAPSNLPAPIRRLLRRCLEKDPKQRLSSIADARLELNEHEPLALPAAAALPVARSSIVSRIWPVAAAVAVTALAMYFARSSAVPADLTETRTSIIAPPGTVIYPDSAMVAISPDGTQVAFVTGDIQGITGLWVRPVGSLVARRLEGTRDGSGQLPFWSADSKRIGFFTSGKLRTVAAAGGVIQTVCSSPGSGGRGATWNASNVIVFARDASGPLFKVSANGGEPEPVTTLAANQLSHRFPTFLPDGDHFLYIALPGRNGKFDVFVGSLSGAASKLIGQMESSPEYAAPGYLLFPRQNVLAAQPFDPKSLTLSGESFSLPDQPTVILDPAQSFTGGKVVSAAPGALAYFSAPVANMNATWFNASGKDEGTVKLPEGQYSGVSISPDGRRAVVVRSTSTTESSLWLVDLEHGGAVPLTAGGGRNDSPVWSPDGKRIVFASDRDGPQDFFVKNVSDAQPEQPFYRSPVMFKNPEGFSVDGAFLFYQSLDSDSAQNIHLLPTTGPQTPQTYIKGPQRDFLSSQSPDGKHVAYTSDETGRFEIYVDSFPVSGDKRQVSTDGGLSPAWSHDGKHLLFVGNDGGSIWRADVMPGADFRLSKPVRTGSIPVGARNGAFDPMTQRLLALVPDQTGPGAVTIVQNWLKK
jgi:Tol biopolymer transport system component